MADSVICSTSSNSSSDWDSHDSLRFLGSQITWKVPGNWVTESLMLCWDIKHKRKSFHKVSKMQMVALCQEVHPMLSPPSRSCSPWILLVECLMQTVTKTPPRVLFFSELGLPLDLEAKPKCISFQLALHSSGVLQSSGATNSTSSGWQSLAPFLCGFWGEILMSHWGRREHGKLGTTLHWCWWHW